MRQIQIGIIGYGIVGTGVAKILMEQKDLLASRTGAGLNLKKIADLDIETDRGITLPDGTLSTDAHEILNDPEIDIVIELVGGEGVARDFIMKAIENGKHVITANKALIASHGNEIFKAAHEKGVEVAFEASVAGCIPVIKTIRESLTGTNIHSISGILNGTCNYILTEITKNGSPFDEVLKEAQKIGFAEADPTLDIEGYDTAHKLAILNSLAYGMTLNLDDIYVEGISGMSPMDFEFAKKFGYTIKLLAISKITNGAIEARIHPTMIPDDSLLSSVSGSKNAVKLCGDAIEDIVLYGHGAGMLPTANAVVGDITDIARNMLTKAAGRVPALACKPEHLKDIPVLPIDEITTHYYIRINAADQPNVLSQISGILGDKGISIKSVLQTERRNNGSVPVFIVTHSAKEANVKSALEKISKLDIISGNPTVIRME